MRVMSYSKAPIMRTEHLAVLTVHSIYCRTGIRTSTYDKNFRVYKYTILNLVPGNYMIVRTQNSESYIGTMTQVLT